MTEKENEHTAPSRLFGGGAHPAPLHWLFFPAAVLYHELLLRAFDAQSVFFDGALALILLFAVGTGLFWSLIVNLLRRPKAAFIVSVTVTALWSVLVCVEYCCRSYFKSYFFLRFIGNMSENVVTGFGSAIPEVVLPRLPLRPRRRTARLRLRHDRLLRRRRFLAAHRVRSFLRAAARSTRKTPEPPLFGMAPAFHAPACVLSFSGVRSGHRPFSILAAALQKRSVRSPRRCKSAAPFFRSPLTQGLSPPGPSAGTAAVPPRLPFFSPPSWGCASDSESRARPAGRAFFLCTARRGRHQGPCPFLRGQRPPCAAFLHAARRSLSHEAAHLSPRAAPAPRAALLRTARGRSYIPNRSASGSAAAAPARFLASCALPPGVRPRSLA